MARYAMIVDQVVENVCEWDGITPWTPPANTQAVLCPDDVGIGWTYDGVTWAAPDTDDEGG